MADDCKKYSAREAAIAILDKAKEVLHKAEEMDKCGTFTKVHAKAKREGYSEESADKIAGHAKVMDKAEKGVHKGPSGQGTSDAGSMLATAAYTKQPGLKDKMIAGAKESHKKVLGEMKAMPKPNLGKAEPVGEIHPKEHVEGEEEKPGKRIEHQAAPEKNPKEQAEGNNELAGTTPTQVGKDGKNLPGFDEMNSLLKLAKFIGHMESKRKRANPKLGKGY